MIQIIFFKGATNKTEIEQELKDWVEEIQVFKYVLLTFLIVDGYWSRLRFSECSRYYLKCRCNLHVVDGCHEVIQEGALRSD